MTEILISNTGNQTFKIFWTYVESSKRFDTPEEAITNIMRQHPLQLNEPIHLSKQTLLGTNSIIISRRYNKKLEYCLERKIPKATNCIEIEYDKTRYDDIKQLVRARGRKLKPNYILTPIQFNCWKISPSTFYISLIRGNLT